MDACALFRLLFVGVFDSPSKTNVVSTLDQVISSRYDWIRSRQVRTNLLSSSDPLFLLVFYGTVSLDAYSYTVTRESNRNRNKRNRPR
jgi:hypothetical protein